MKSFSSILTIGALLAFASSVVAAPVPDAVPVPAMRTEYVWHTVYHTKIVGVTKTEWVDPATTTTTRTKPTTTTTTTTTTTDEEATTTMTTSSTTTSTTTSIIDKKTEKKYPPTTTTTTSTTTTSTTTSPTTTEERTTAIDVPTPTQLEPTIPDIEVKVVTTTQESTPAPSPKSQSSSKESWEGDATYYDPGVGSCGNTNGPGDMIAAISYLVMDPLNPGNPNNNPICGKQIRCTRDGLKETIITVVDRCPVCKAGDLDLSPAAYAALGGTIAEGRFKIQCSWV